MTTTIQISAICTNGANLTWNESDFSGSADTTIESADGAEFDRAVQVAKTYPGIKSVSMTNIDWATGEATVLFNAELN